MQETRKVCRRLLHLLFAVVARDLLGSLLEGAAIFELCNLEEIFKKSISLHLCDLQCHQKLRPMILDC